jgi:hypothetical protein
MPRISVPLVPLVFLGALVLLLGSLSGAKLAVSEQDGTSAKLAAHHTESSLAMDSSRLTLNSITPGWQSTGLKVAANQSFRVWYNWGNWSVDYRNFPSVGPEGYTPSIDSQIYAPCKDYPEKPFGYMMGTVSNNDSSYPVYVGSGGTWQSPISGTLMLKINDKCLLDNSGVITMSAETL